ncbi:MAG: hypothetical protein LAO79_21070 [Acidobacteriia bacterium]|nr:hypothetical protein [Terriglobia bacterium]
MTPKLRRMLAFGALSLLLGAIVRFWPDDSSAAVPAAAAESIPVAERRLANLREQAATVPGKQEILKKAAADLAAREKGLLVADTAPQAQAQLIQIFREIGRAETPPVEIRSTEGFSLRPLGDSYGEASVSVAVECRIDQLVNMLAAIAARPELVATSDVRISSNNQKDKAIGVHLTLSGVVPRKLVPEKHS